MAEGIEEETKTNEESPGSSPDVQHPKVSNSQMSKELDRTGSHRNHDQQDFEEETNFLLNIINTIFEVNSNQNILKVGNKFQSLIAS